MGDYMLNNLQKIKGRVITQNDLEYKKDRLVWNLHINKYPYYIVYPIDNSDIMHCLKFIKENNLEFRIRNGGHSYEGYCTLNNGVIIDLSLMNKITLTNDSVIVEGGTKNKELYDFLTNLDYPFPGGDCPTVGVSGYTLGGGYGYSARLMGLGIDSLKEIEMINYKGELLIANQNRNEDLFWACRGAGQNNFGIITKLTYKLPSKIKKITYIELHYTNCNDPISVFDTWQNWLDNLDNRITLTIRFSKYDHGIHVFGRGIFYGEIEEAAQLLAPYQKLTHLKMVLKDITFKQAINIIMSSGPTPERMCDFGLFANRKYNRSEICDILSVLNSPNDFKCMLTLYAMGGKIADIDSSATAFYYRKSNYIIAFKTDWEKECETVQHLNYVYQSYNKIKKYTRGAYMNNPYSNLEDWEYNYFGENIRLLKQVKQKYDPYNFFCYEQSIKSN